MLGHCPSIVRFVCVLLFLQVGFVTADSVYAKGWVKSEKISSEPIETVRCEPKIATDSSDSMVAVWCQSNGSGVTDLYVATKLEGGEWSTPEVISSGKSAAKPAIAYGTSSEGESEWLLAWVETDSSTANLKVATSSDGQVWEERTEKSYSGLSVNAPVVSSSSGKWLLAVETESSSTESIESASENIADESAWSSSSINLVESGPYEVKDLELIQSDAQAALAWLSEDASTGNLRVRESTHSSSSWKSPSYITADSYSVASYSMAYENGFIGEGRLVVSRPDSSTGNKVVEIYKKSSAGGWASGTKVLSDSSKNSSSPSVVLSDSSIVVTWVSGYAVEGISQNSSGKWSSISTLPMSSGTITSSSLATTSSGRSVAYWSNYRSDTLKWSPEVAFKENGLSIWNDSAETLSTLDDSDNSLDGEFNLEVLEEDVLAYWVNSELSSGDKQLYLSYYDTVKPSVESIRVDTDTVTVNQPVTLSIEASDNYTPDSELVYEWDFGDGESDSSTGSDVEHTFKEVGTYTVSLKVTDESGNESNNKTLVVEVVEEPLSPGGSSGGSSSGGSSSSGSTGVGSGSSGTSSGNFTLNNSSKTGSSESSGSVGAGSTVASSFTGLKIGRKTKVTVSKYSKGQKSKYLSVVLKGLELECQTTACAGALQLGLQVQHRGRSKRKKLFTTGQLLLEDSSGISASKTLKFKIRVSKGRQLYRYVKSKRFKSPTLKVVVYDLVKNESNEGSSLDSTSSSEDLDPLLQAAKRTKFKFVSQKKRSSKRKRR